MAAAPSDLIVLRPEGLYCPAGDFHIDPWRPVARAVITHAHADHARRGHAAYLATALSEGLLRARLGSLSMQGLHVLGDFFTAEERLTLAIPLPDDREVVTKATVRRRDEESISVEFDQLDWDDMFALARFLHPRLP